MIQPFFKMKILDTTCLVFQIHQFKFHTNIHRPWSIQLKICFDLYVMKKFVKFKKCLAVLICLFFTVRLSNLLLNAVVVVLSMLLDAVESLPYPNLVWPFIRIPRCPFTFKTTVVCLQFCSIVVFASKRILMIILESPTTFIIWVSFRTTHIEIFHFYAIVTLP